MALGKNLPIYFWRRHFSVLHTVWTVDFVNYLFNNFHMRFLKMTFGNQPEKKKIALLWHTKLYSKKISTSFNTKNICSWIRHQSFSSLEFMVSGNWTHELSDNNANWHHYLFVLDIINCPDGSVQPIGCPFQHMQLNSKYI